MDWRAILIVLAVAACDPRRAHPVATSQPTDADLTCEDINDQINANQRQAAVLTGLDDEVEDVNIAVGTAGALLLSWPLFFAIDLSQKESIELRALYDRTRHLARLSQAKGCQRQEPETATAPPSS